MSKKLFVGNLPFDVNDADLATVLAVAGKVVDAKVIINNKTGRSKGYGFVELETEELAADAVKKFEGATLNERPLTVQLATPKQEADAKSDDKADGEKSSGEKSGDAAANGGGEKAPVKRPEGTFAVKSAESASASSGTAETPANSSEEAALAASAPSEDAAQAQVAAAATDATNEQGA